MPIARTDMRDTRESARRIRFEPTTTIPQTDVQLAIEAAAALAVAPPGFTPTVVTFAMSPYAPSITDTYLLVDTTGGAVTIQLPLSAARLGASGYVPLTVKDDTRNAAANVISVVRSGAELIDGFITYPLDANAIATTFLPKAAGGYDVV